MSNLGDINVRDAFVERAKIYKAYDGRDRAYIRAYCSYRKPKSETEYVYTKYTLASYDEYIIAETRRIEDIIKDKHCKVGFMGQIMGVNSSHVDKTGQTIHYKSPVVSIFLRSLIIYDTRYRKSDYEAKRALRKPYVSPDKTDEIEKDIETRSLDDKLPF